MILLAHSFLFLSATTYTLYGVELISNQLDLSMCQELSEYEKQLCILERKPSYIERDKIIKSLVEEHDKEPDKIYVGGKKLAVWLIQSYCDKNNKSVQEYGIMRYLISHRLTRDNDFHKVLDDDFKQFINSCYEINLDQILKEKKATDAKNSNRPKKRIVRKKAVTKHK